MTQNDAHDTRALPDGWANARIRDTFEIHYGKGLTKASRDESGQVPVYGSSGIVGYHTKALVDSPCVIVGRKGAVGEVYYSEVPCWPIDTTYYICPPDGFSHKYLCHLLHSLNLGTLDKSTTIPGLNRDDFYAEVIPIAPLPEQHRIVAEIETQFTRLEAGVAALKRAQANLCRYRAAVLKSACEGRLVPTEAELARAEDHDYEPADALLQRILAERRATWEAENPHRKYKEPAPPDTSDLPELPEGWVWTTLDEVSCHITSGSRGWAKYYSESGSLFIRAQDISTDELVLDTVASVELPESVEGVRTQVFKDDLLVTITGANVTKAALARQEFDEAYVSQHVGLVRPVLTGTSPYLYYWIVSPTHGRRILEKDAYGAGKPGLSLANLRELVVALPCLAEQDRIVAEVEQRLSVVVALEREVEVALVRAQRLRQSILKHAFEGKLVPQNPADKPASELLEHIKVLSRKLKKEQKRRRDRQRKQRAEEEHRISVGTPSELRELVRQLQRQTGGPIPVEQLLTMSKLEIEEFHILLREGIRSGHIREQRDGYWAFLETADENQEPMD